MSIKLPRWITPWRKTTHAPGDTDSSRRRILGSLAAAGAAGLGAASARAEEAPLRFPGDPAEHKVVYQLNKADSDYHEHILFSVGAMLRKYDDNVDIVVVAFGPGIHILAKKPERPVSKLVSQRVSSLSQYGVKFHACGNTMKTLGWKDEDMLPFAEVVEVGAADLMELQEQGYAYLSW